MEHDTAGDPVTGVKWTRRTTHKIAAELAAGGIDVCPNTVAGLLRQLGFRLRVNHKKLAGRADPGRDAQFAHIAAQRQQFAANGWPLISVDAKHRELVGNFANHGRAWTRQPIEVNTYDFPSQADGVAIPYGVYDTGTNRASVFVGTSHNTPAFAVDNLAKWWLYDGRRRYPGATHLLVLADGGGSNGAKARAWKHALQKRLCDRHGLTVTVCHYPTGASKYNPVEHRLFGEISKNWAGRPLDTYETILNYIRTTTTTTGLKVKAYLVTTDYPTGVTTTDEEMAQLQIRPHDTQPARNYTLGPRTHD
jgi:Rhodopirellula transposase DDE domain